MNEEPFPKLAEPEEPTAPGTPPSPPELSAGTSQDAQVSRKREREVSLEPAVPLADFDSARKDKQNAKKNRLDPTLEESDSGPIRPDSPSPSILQTSEVTPQLAMSPPHETKMHHISRRVEHIGWKNGGGQSATPETALEPSLSRERSDHSLPSLPRESSSTSTKEPEVPRRSSMESIIDTGISPAIPPPETPSAITTPPEERTVEAILEPGVAKRRSVDSVVSTSGTKRPREDDEKDENPRETKRPSPPPEKEKEKAEVKPILPSTPSKFGGFMSYASTASPFSSVKGNNVFKSKPSSFESMPSPFSSNPNNLGSQNAPSSPPKDEPDALKRNAATSSSDPPSPKGESAPSKRNAFTAFASAASPFASAAAKRAKSPSVSGDRDRPAFGMGSPFARATRGTERAKSPTRRAGSATASAFTTYASGGATGFGSPFGTPVASRAPVRASSLDSGRKEEASKKSGSGSEGSAEEAEEDEERGKVSFGDRLRAQTNEEAAEERDKLELTEQEVTTGEEEEETLYQVRGKLFQLSDANQWRERGTGALKLNVRQADGDGARLVMRKEAVHTLILNVPLFKGMVISLAQDPRYIRFSTIEDGNTVHYNLRVSSAKVAQELLDEVTSNIPSA